jgi:hypothetical protein
MSFEVIKLVYNKTFVEIMKNTVHFRSVGNTVGISRLNKSDVKIGEDERFLIGTTVFKTILYLFLRQPAYWKGEHHAWTCWKRDVRDLFFTKLASHIHRQENQLITVFQRYCLSSIERWAFRLSKTPLLARFHSNGESGRLDEVRGRRRWVGVLVVELLRI